MNKNYKNGYTLTTGIEKETQGKIELLCDMIGTTKAELVRLMIIFVGRNINTFLKFVSTQKNTKLS